MFSLPLSLDRIVSRWNWQSFPIVVSMVVLASAQALSAEPAVLELLLKDTPKPRYGVPVPRQITGRVVRETGGSVAGAVGVSVTDGYTVVKTDRDGQFSIVPDRNAVFLYFTRPSGHDVVGQWYKPLSETVHFTIKPVDADENDYTFIHVTDTHVSRNRRSLVGLSRFVREANAMTPRPRFVVNSGDLLDLNKALLSKPASGHADFRNYVGIMNHLKMPHYNVAGDHTDSSYRLDQFPRGDHRCGKALYWEYLGPHFFSFEYGKIHFVSVDFGYHLGKRKILVNGKNLDYPTNRVQPVHVKWLKQDMGHRSRGTFVITTAEADLENHCPDFLEMARQHDVRMQLVGDIHVLAHKKRTVPYRAGGALAGCWWNPRTNQLCPDLMPQGYLVYRVRGEKLEQFYKGLGQRVAIVSHRVGAAWKGRVTIRAHLVQPLEGEQLEYSINDRDWMKMQETGRPFYRAMFAATVDTASVPDGLLNLRVRNARDGEIRSRVVVVANGRSASPVRTGGTLGFTVGAPSNGWTKAQAAAGKVDVLLNGKSVGSLEPGIRKSYTFPVPADALRLANTLSFRFSMQGDGMTITAPVLKYDKATLRDIRDKALRLVKSAHWGDAAADWGGFIVGEAEPPDESPFHRRQNVFCFVFGKTP
tara:strand:- start:166 stop:2100 length:1935 start_codon:yes stop_codon:yes gene_type:complete